MKRIIAFIYIISLLLLFPVSSFADSTTDSTINIDQFGFSVSVPSDWYTFTQDTSMSSSVWDDFDVDPSYFIDYLSSNNIYLDSIAPDFSCEIVLLVRQSQSYSEIYNLSLYDDDKILKELGDSFNSTAEKLGLSIESKKLYITENYKFFCCSGQQKTDDQIVCIESFVTVVNGICVQINLRSYSGSISRQQAKTVRNVVNSLSFNKILSKPSSISSTNVSRIVYKALVGGLVALIVGIPSLMFGNKKRKTVETDDAPIKPEMSKTYETTRVTEEPCSITDIEKKPLIQEETKTRYNPIESTDTIEEIRKYKQLLDEGIITQEEFDAKKKQLLGL